MKIKLDKLLRGAKKVIVPVLITAAIEYAQRQAVKKVRRELEE